MTDLLNLAEDPQRKAYLDAGIWGSSITLDDLFMRNLRRAPDKVILSDPPNKRDLMGCAPLHLTAVEADRMINTLCARFTEIGLSEGQTVALQLPNTVELPLTLLACLRSGLVPAFLPLLWSERDILAALDPLNVQALISVTSCANLKPADKLRYAAASLFSVRYLMAFGAEMPDGVLDLNSIYDARGATRPQRQPARGKADNAALITFRFTSHGPTPVVHSHNQAMSAALTLLLEAQMEPDTEIMLSTLQPSSLAGLATGVLPWLLSGGCLVLHQGGNATTLVEQIAEEKVTRAIVPGATLTDICKQLGYVQHSLQSLVAVHANAATVAPQLTVPTPFAVVDGYALDEFSVLMRARGQDGHATQLQLGPQVSPSFGVGPALVELGLSAASRLTVRGPSVPYNKDNKNGQQQTGYLAQMRDDALNITGRADQVAFVGGLAVCIDEVASLILSMEGVEAVQVKTVKDALFGEMLEARLHFARSTLTQNQRIDNLRQEFENRQVAPYKIPARFVIDPLIVKEKDTLLKSEGKKAV